ncbi:hypothetical protein I4I73_28985 [Pseudonocardia sp. KRD-184]|uniref:Secreted protein n=1 Tax=Pseudonocardia oceani TaxID=2792013 RepID=A0ABS6UK15_9PSEU|nr:hypothetical protein [Pseudonocardia oceani]MBW0088218.1 hypothetical protein [Pseudonocardia oceani]MBW0100020.1 hypothetical protein [Pseudonocardia oceani]MBW0121147.1 hypothetical protein [Pseudonocardia oceani]MBW0131167.1 hypothetical protein [Pseudonocardia oceani]MBW0132571.1 hypothetical protein [Pseudonocardia oceani]
MSAISPEFVSAVFVGLAALIAALSTYTANRSRRMAEDQRLRKQQLRHYRDRYEALLAYTWLLREELAERGLAIPPRPRILEDDDDDDFPRPASPAPAPRGGGPDAG